MDVSGAVQSVLQASINKVKDLKDEDSLKYAYLRYIMTELPLVAKSDIQALLAMLRYRKYLH